ncbi:MAG: glycoside hydrolase family 88 protein, partial [Verrucomicrobia bacterium]|nr:glycoside hydrolase family 88 protein [Verrucomicrobiota bacterium]
MKRFAYLNLGFSLLVAQLVAIGVRGAEATVPKQFHGATPLQWSVRLADSETARRGDRLAWREGRNAKWDYTAGLFTLSLLKLNQVVPTPAYVEFSKDAIGSFIKPDGSIQGYKLEDYNIDNIAPGKTVLALYEITKEERYRKCADLLRQQLATHPRTSDGGFWHKRRYPSQMWLDGLFMGASFYAEYTQDFGGPAADFDDVLKQFRLVDTHLYDAKSGLYYHGWDEKRTQDWADKTTGCSPNFWGRAMGWWAMAQVDVLDFLPKDHKGRAEIVTLIKKTSAGIVKHQDPASGLWWQVMDKGGQPGNYLEATASAMFVYSMAKAVNHGYLARDCVPAILMGYEGIIGKLIKTDGSGKISLTRCCSVAGLGYGRDGSYEYYLREPVIDNDLKGVGPFILAGIELQKLLGLPIRAEHELRATPTAKPRHADQVQVLRDVEFLVGVLGVSQRDGVLFAALVRLDQHHQLPKDFAEVAAIDLVDDEDRLPITTGGHGRARRNSAGNAACPIRKQRVTGLLEWWSKVHPWSSAFSAKAVI